MQNQETKIFTNPKRFCQGGFFFFKKIRIDNYCNINIYILERLRQVTYHLFQSHRLRICPMLTADRPVITKDIDMIPPDAERLPSKLESASSPYCCFSPQDTFCTSLIVLYASPIITRYFRLPALHTTTKTRPQPTSKEMPYLICPLTSHTQKTP